MESPGVADRVAVEAYCPATAGLVRLQGGVSDPVAAVTLRTMASELYPYTFSANVRGRREESLALDDLTGGSGGDFLDSFDSVIQEGAEWPPPPDEDEEDERARISRVEKVLTPGDDDRVRYGRIRVTRQAVRHDVNRPTGETIRVTDEDREGRPLFFWLVVLSGGTRALLLTERRARFGIVKSFWMGVLLEKLREDYPDVTFNFHYFNPQSVWDEYMEHGQALEGAVLRRVVTETREPKEQEQASEERIVGKIKTEIDRRIAPSRRLVARILQEQDRSGAIEVLLGEHAGELGNLDDYDEMRLRLDIGGSRRTVTLGSKQIPPVGYVVEGVAFDTEAYPQVEDMREFAVSLARDIGSSIGIS